VPLGSDTIFIQMEMSVRNAVVRNCINGTSGSDTISRKREMGGSCSGGDLIRLRSHREGLPPVANDRSVDFKNKGVFLPILFAPARFQAALDQGAGLIEEGIVGLRSLKGD